MTKDELIEKIVGIANNSSYEANQIEPMVDSAIVDIAGGGDRQHGIEKLAPLPDLFTIDTITLLADTSSIAMPDTFQRSLSMVIGPDGTPLKLYTSFNMFAAFDPSLTEKGTPARCSLKGRTLWVGPMKSTDTVLTIYFHRYPVKMPTSRSTPDGIPLHLQERLIVNHVLRDAFADIEDGQDGNKTNTIYHTTQFLKAQSDLSRLIGAEDGEPTNVEGGDEDYI